MTTPDRVTSAGEPRPPPVRIARFSEALRPFFHIASARGDDRGALSFTFDAALNHGGLAIEITADDHICARDPIAARDGGLDHIVLLRRKSGVCRGECDGGDFVIGPRDIGVLDLTRPFRFDVERGAGLAMVLPRCFARSLGFPSRHGTMLRRTQTLSTLAHAYLDALASVSPALDRAGAFACVAAVVALVADHGIRCGFGAETNDKVPPAIRAYIDAHLSDRDLTPASIARACGLSRAGLYRTMAVDDGIAGVIRRRRLERAYDALLDPARKGDPLGVIARDVGLSEAAQLSRLFAARYGLPPMDVVRSLDGTITAAHDHRLGSWFAGLDPSEAPAGEAEGGPDVRFGPESTATTS